MFDPKLIELISRALASDDSKNKFTQDGTPLIDVVWKVSVPDAIKALAALCEARPDVAAVLQGDAVVMPLEASEQMLDAHWEQTGESEAMRPRTHAYMQRYYRAMVAVSPHVATPAQPLRQGYISPELLSSLQAYGDSLDKTKVNEFYKLYKKQNHGK
jgi:hypothetical protein